MAYSPTIWVDNGPPDINAANLNKIEQGIVALDGATRYDQAQALSGAQQTQARTNIGAAAVLQVTQSAYDALGTKDPNTLYVIVG